MTDQRPIAKFENGQLWYDRGFKAYSRSDPEHMRFVVMWFRSAEREAITPVGVESWKEKADQCQAALDAYVAVHGEPAND